MLRALRLLVAISVLAGAMIASPLLLWGQSAPSPDPPPSSAQDNSVSVDVNAAPANEPRLAWRGITVNGFASLSYGYNTNQPYDRLNQFRVFDFNDNEPQLDMAQIVVQHAIEKPNQFGFRVNMIAGSGVPEVTAAYGMFRNMQTDVAHHFDIPEIYASYIAPLGKGLRFDVGKMASHLGSEIIGGYDGYNDEFSRGFIFGFGVPFTYTGAKITYPFTSKITGMVVVVNGWDEFQRYNSGYSWGSQITVTPSKTTAIYFNFIHGPERPKDTRDQRSVGEIVGSWKTTPRLNLGFDALYGHEEKGVSFGHDAIWKGLAGYIKYGFTQKFSLAFRGEVFNDGGGTRTGVDQTLEGYTFTPEYDMVAKLSDVASWLKKLDGKFAIRGEVRLDRSNHDVFLTDNPDVLVPHQFTAAINLIYLF
jgi:Putative beta-barrel porin-2, OmpL-like. bbp2